MKRNETMLLAWPLLQAVADFVVLAGSMLLAYQIRFHRPFTDLVPAMYGVPSFQHYAWSALVAGLFWVLFLALRGTYQIELRPSPVRHIGRSLMNFYLGFALLFALLFFYRDFSYSRTVAVLTVVAGSLGLVLVRLLLHAARRRIFPTRPLHRVLLVGPLREQILQRLARMPESGLSLVDAVPEGDELAETVEREGVDTVLLAYPFDQVEQARDVIDRLSGLRLHFLFAPEPRGLLTANPTVLNLAGLPVLRLREDPLAGWNGLVKRTFDLVFSAILLALLSPLFALLALLVALTSRGPVLYRQERMGLDGRPFEILKFRTMRTDAEKGSGPVWAQPGDPRATPVGRFLRRWSLDELPQLLNVLRGDMSLVGPRPERPEFVREFRDAVPRYMERHRVRSGMTGWAQVNGLRGQAPIEERTRYDLFYIEHWSLGLDLWILARTLVAVVAGKDAY